jgi:hypothetical protein
MDQDIEPFKIVGIRRHEDGSITVYKGTDPYREIGRVTIDPHQFRSTLTAGDHSSSDLGLFPSERDAIDAIIDSL